MDRNGPLKGHNGQALTQALFYETSSEDKFPASYTTKNEDFVKKGVTYLSLKQIYLTCLDPTEEEFVQLAFDGNRRQWERVTVSPALSRYFGINLDDPSDWIFQWRSDLEIKLKSMGIKAIIDEATTGGKSAFSAAKWLAEGGWKLKRGRPSKVELKKEKKERQNLLKEHEEDTARMEEIERKFSVVDGSKKDS